MLPLTFCMINPRNMQITARRYATSLYHYYYQRMRRQMRITLKARSRMKNKKQKPGDDMMIHSSAFARLRAPLMLYYSEKKEKKTNSIFCVCCIMGRLQLIKGESWGLLLLIKGGP